jgi:hypothetical protein
MHPKYLQKGVNVMPEYPLTSPLILPAGEYFIGFKQKISTGIGVGFDRNTNHSDQLVFDSGSGWSGSSIPGSLMIHPVVGRKILPPVGVKEQSRTLSDFLVYPNPSNELLNVLLKENSETEIILQDVIGKEIYRSRTRSAIHQIPVQNLSDGIYIITCISEGKGPRSEKIIVQH